MKPILLLAVLLTATLWAAAQTTNPPAKAKSGADAKAEQEIKQRAAEYEKAMLNRDADALSRMLAEELLISDGNGAVYGKAPFLEATKAIPNQVKYDDYHFEEMVMNVYGNTALLNLITVSKGRHKNGEFSGRARTTAMVVKQKGQCQVVAFHNSTIKQP